MRANRTTLAAVLSIALAVVPAAVAAQSADEELATPSYFTSINTEGVGFMPGNPQVGFFDWGYRTTSGFSYTSEADDPRASGELEAAIVLDNSNDGMFRGAGTLRLVNEGGSWEGPGRVVHYPDGTEFRIALLEGQDGYEGLTLTRTDFIDPSGEEHSQGLIWEGEVPQLSAADALPE